MYQARMILMRFPGNLLWFKITKRMVHALQRAFKAPTLMGAPRKKRTHVLG